MSQSKDSSSADISPANVRQKTRQVYSLILIAHNKKTYLTKPLSLVNDFSQKTKSPQALRSRAFTEPTIANEYASTSTAPFAIQFTYFQPVTSAIALPNSAGLATVLTPAASRAANFSAAVPLPPEMIAPA